MTNATSDAKQSIRNTLNWFIRVNGQFIGSTEPCSCVTAYDRMRAIEHTLRAVNAREAVVEVEGHTQAPGSLILGAKLKLHDGPHATVSLREIGSNRTFGMLIEAL